MKKFFAIAGATLACISALAQTESTVIVNPAQNASNAVRVNWHTPVDSPRGVCYYTLRTDKDWRNAQSQPAFGEVITAYDSLSSKLPNGQDCVERVRFLRNTAQLDRLQPGTEYMYRFSQDPKAEVRYFKTAPANDAWTAAVISDFHSYAPLPKRTEAAMAMLDTLESVHGAPFDMVMHVGDVCAWGGSYSFWRDLYAQPAFRRYMWAGVNGNHDNMDRRSKRLSNDYFRYANYNPNNGYSNERGVCYSFRYGQVLFIMLNSEVMRTEQGLAEAQEWVKRTIQENPAKYVVVVEHYQWFFGTDGSTSQYARWNKLFDEYGVDLAIAGNNHIYARTNALYNDTETDGRRGTVYVQTPSADNERGQATKEWTQNRDKIKYIWSEGPKTVGALLMNVDNNNITLTLYNRNGAPLDTVTVRAKR